MLATCVILGTWANPASAADNTLTASIPLSNSVVPVSPPTITLKFAAQVGPSPQVSMACGNPGVVQATGQPALQQDQLTVLVQLLSPAPKGTCTVSWRVTDVNLQPAGNGSFKFSIINDTAAAPTTSTSLAPGATAPSTTIVTSPGSGSGDSTTPTKSGSSGPLGLFRLVSNLGLAMLFGGLVVIAIAWPEGVEYILTVRHLRTVWVVAAGGTFLFVAALEASQTGKGLGSSLIPTSWGDLLDTTSGKAALLRLAFVAGSIYVVARPERAIDPATQPLALGPPALALVTLGFSREEFGLANWAVGSIHALAMGVWIGGLVLLTRVVLAGPGDEDLVHAVRGFARISAPALWLTVGTGAIELFQLDRGHLGSGHGLVLIVKTLMVSLMVFVGVAARQFINQRVSRVDTMTAPLATRMRRALGIEAIVGVVVLALTAWLLALTPPGLVGGTGNRLDIRAAHRFANSALNVDVSVAFTERVGINDVRIEVTSPPTGVSALSVDFLPPLNTGVNGMSIDATPLTGKGVAVLSKSTGFALSAAGTWTLVVRMGATEVGRQDVYVGDPSLAATTTSPAAG